uniref:Uncharacterized protein n=1 Tax=Pipistrellus kuhlii TaxID=59472 RepID=A0A7J7TW70_PIPKU|nr:hypothetical protein mPipKuh1_009264 [Pipistrellus kuhlii]
MYPYAHCSIIQGGQDMETAKVSFDRGLDKEDVVQLSSMAQWLMSTYESGGHSSILGQGTCLGGGHQEAAISNSLSSLMFLSLSPSPFLSEIDKNIFKIFFSKKQKIWYVYTAECYSTIRKDF